MTHFMYISGCDGVTPTPLSSLLIVQFLLSKTIDDLLYVLVYAMESPLTPLSSLFIVQVLLSQTLNDSSYVY